MKPSENNEAKTSIPPLTDEEKRVIIEKGFRLEDLRVFDMMPMTSEVEVVATLVGSGVVGRTWPPVCDSRGVGSNGKTSRGGSVEYVVEDFRHAAALLKDNPAWLELREAIESFDELWAELFPAERGRILRLLIERVTYDGEAGEIEITFRPGGVRTLLEEVGVGGETQHEQEHEPEDER